jgi:hypothetical protein
MDLVGAGIFCLIENHATSQDIFVNTGIFIFCYRKFRVYSLFRSHKSYEYCVQDLRFRVWYDLLFIENCR